jgi:glycosyltransferase involved in cell wall biosynthesis
MELFSRKLTNKRRLNILFIADPNSIHDIRWLNFICEQGNNQGFLICRMPLYEAYIENASELSRKIAVLGSVVDPSTVRPWRNLAQAFKIRRLIRKHKVDILHILYAEPNALWAMFKLFFNVPVIVTTHGTDILKTIPAFFTGKTILFKLISCQYRMAFARVDHFTCTSHSQMQILRGLGVTRPMSVVRTGVDLELIRSSNLNMAHSLGIRRPFVLMPRNMKPVYNHELTLDAIALLAGSVRETFSFVFINADTKDSDYFSKMYEKARTIHATIHFCRSLTHEEIISLSKQASLILMNPLSDGSPVSAMEAMACMVPVILPPLPYDPEVFDGVLSFEGWNAKALSNSIGKVLDGESPVQRLERLADRIEKEGNIKVEMNKLMSIYNESLNLEA